TLDVHVLARLEQGDRQVLAHLVRRSVGDAELLQVPGGRKIALLELAQHRPREARLLVGAEAELDRGVAVPRGRPHLGDGARSRLDHGHRQDVALVVVELRHADLFADEADHGVVSQVLISMSTPAGMSSFSRASMVCALDRVMSISRLWIRISNCSRDFLSTCGLRSTVYTVFLVGSGTGPEVMAPVRRAVRTISDADWSSVAWSYDFSLMRIFWSMSFGPLRDDVADNAGAHRATALADREPQSAFHRDRRDQLH